MTFAFTPDQRDQLFGALGRSDSGAWHLTEDVERALDAHCNAELANDVAVEPPSPAVEFAPIRAHIAQLCAELSALPERARRLAALEAIPTDAVADLVRLANAGDDALGHLSARLAALGSGPVAHVGPTAKAERFVHAVGKAFRNRLNIKPTSDRHGLFRRFLDSLFELVARRDADLHEFSRVMTDERLAQILTLE